MMAAALAFATVLGGGAVTDRPVAANDFFPEVGDFRSQEIRRLQGEAEWPFVAEKGMLLCAKILKRPAVYFAAENDGGEHGFPFVISGDMMEVAISNIGNTGVLRPFDDFEQLLKRLFPYVAMGKRLCDQPPGTNLPDNAL